MKYPFTKQEGLKDCAAACVQMIIKYYKGYISINDLNEDLNTTKEGVSAYNIIKTLEKHGFKAEGIRTNIEEITCLTPIIAHVTLDNKYNHYVVIYKIKKESNSLVIADPQSKIKKIKIDDFKKIFNNVIIIMIPNKTIEFRNYNANTILRKIIIKETKLLKELIQISLIYMILSVTSTFYFKILIDKINYSEKILKTIFLFFILIKLHQTLTNYVRINLLIHLNKKIDMRLKVDTYEKILDLPYNYYRNKTTGEIITRYEELNKIRDTITKILLTIFLDIPLALFAIIIMYLISFELTQIAILILILYALILLIYKKTIKENIEKEQLLKAQLNNHINENIHGIETINSLRIKKKSIKKFETLYIKHLNQIVKNDKILNSQQTSKEIINQLGEMIIIFLGIILVKQNHLTIGGLLTYISILGFFLSPIKNLLSLDYDIIEAKKIIKRIKEMLIKENNNGKVVQVKGNIEINNLNFSYDDRRILKNIKLNIRQGEKILITGKSGSGKSTLLKILMKYYKVEREKIKINKLDINDITPTSILISQNETLFTDSIENNINLDNRNDFLKIADLCYVNKIVNNNLGYNTIIEENGFNISGGQRQRIILARALNRKSDILLIDEGLNQIDVNLERKILKNIFSTYKDKTIIIVSHRLVNMDLYQRFIRLENGKIIEDVKRN